MRCCARVLAASCNIKADIAPLRFSHPSQAMLPGLGQTEAAQAPCAPNPAVSSRTAAWACLTPKAACAEPGRTQPTARPPLAAPPRAAIPTSLQACLPSPSHTLLSSAPHFAAPPASPQYWPRPQSVQGECVLPALYSREAPRRPAGRFPGGQPHNAHRESRLQERGARSAQCTGRGATHCPTLPFGPVGRPQR